MCAEVYKHQHNETGGNLFGLWTTSGSAVIHVVLGPGQHCKRTNTSFHQDLEYMGRVGRFVNDNYMLCHIGEWHSHHNLSLSKPSAGDESTIRRNFPQGMSKFLVIIANIRNGDTIKLSPYFFTHGGTRYEIAEREVIQLDSPFSTDAKILAEIGQGAEGKEYHRRSETTVTEIANRSGASSRNNANRRNMGLNDNTNPTHLQANQRTLLSLTVSTSKPNPSSSDSLVHSSMPASTANPSVVNPHSAETSANASAPESQANPSGSTPGGHEEPMETDESDLHPPRDYDVTPASQHSDSAGNQADPEDEETLSEHDIVLKKILDHLIYWFGSQTDSMFKFEKSKDSPRAIEISFKHNDKYWMVRFPCDFPTNPANLFFSPWAAAVRSNKCTGPGLVKPLKNEVNILLTIKNICGTCNVCKHFTKDSLSQPDLNSRSMEKLAVSLNTLVSELANSFQDVTALNVTHPLHTSHAEIKFKHKCWHWIINLPAQFPEIPAKVSYLYHEESSQKHDAVLHGKYGPKDLNTSKLIIKAVHSNCSCETCLQTQRQY